MPVTPEEARGSLRGLIDDTRFVASERNRRFLEHVVEEELQGRGEHIKAYSIAVAVLRRGADFDPSLDPIVRIEAGRLRRALDDYYAQHAPDAAIRIVIPKGRYRPIFERTTPNGSRREPDPPAMPAVLSTSDELAPPPPSANGEAPSPWPQPAHRRRLAVACMGGALALILAAAVVWHARSTPPALVPPDASPGAAARSGPVILVAPLLTLDKDPVVASLAVGLTRDVIDRMLRFSSFNVYGPPLYERAMSSGNVDFVDLARHIDADYVVDGELRRLGEQVAVTVQLQERASGRYVWTYRKQLPFETGALFGSLLDVASQIAGALGQPMGVINRTEWLERQPRTLDAYGCVLQTHHYYLSIDAAGHRAVRDCLERAVASEPGYASAWAALAWVYLDESRYKLNPRPELYDPDQKARDAVERALALEPDNEMALNGLATLSFRANEMDRFRAIGERLVTINPNDPELLLDYGGRLAFIGDWDAGMPLVQRSAAIALEPSGIYWMVMAWNSYRQGDDQAARREADQIRMPEFQLALLTQAAIYGQLDLVTEAAPLLHRLAELRPDVAADPGAWLISLHFEPRFAARLVEGLRKAGWNAPALLLP